LLLLLLTLTACSNLGSGTAETVTDTEATTGVIATDSSKTENVRQQAEVINVENVTYEETVPKWALWTMLGGALLFALIIPSPFKFKGFP